MKIPLVHTLLKPLIVISLLITGGVAGWFLPKGLRSKQPAKLQLVSASTSYDLKASDWNETVLVTAFLQNDGPGTFESPVRLNVGVESSKVSVDFLEAYCALFPGELPVEVNIDSDSEFRRLAASYWITSKKAGFVKPEEDLRLLSPNYEGPKSFTVGFNVKLSPGEGAYFSKHVPLPQVAAKHPLSVVLETGSQE